MISSKMLRIASSVGAWKAVTVQSPPQITRFITTSAGNLLTITNLYLMRL